jgi:hypothetical protein
MGKLKLALQADSDIAASANNAIFFDKQFGILAPLNSSPAALLRTSRCRESALFSWQGERSAVHSNW